MPVFWAIGVFWVMRSANFNQHRLKLIFGGYVNPFFCRVTGYTHKEVLGKNWFDNLLSWYSQQLIKTVNIIGQQS
ncbi:MULTISPECIES: PAS domain S-box protein [unclassified Microcoleus]|uniref:PAS domain S-box protein n=1 Tax=unclassified Microcoleus TaxID=2642155 RepID=UPI002FD44C66